MKLLVGFLLVFFSVCNAQTLPLVTQSATGQITVSTGDVMLSDAPLLFQNEDGMGDGIASTVIDYHFEASQWIIIPAGTIAVIYVTDGSDGNPAGTLIVGDPTGASTCGGTCLVMPWLAWVGAPLAWFDGMNVDPPSAIPLLVQFLNGEIQ